MKDGIEKSPAPIFPRHPTRLLGSKWTRIEEEGVTHFRVVEHRKDHNLRLQALCKDTSVVIPWRALRERARWRPGWADERALRPPGVTNTGSI
ncbi:MAG: TIGR02450 family Trp-rich protein [Myxococcota bacterium]